MQHLGPQRGQLARLAVSDAANQARCRDLAGIGCEEPRHIGPDLQQLGAGQRGQQSRRRVGAATAKQTGLPVRCAGNEALGHDDVRVPDRRVEAFRRAPRRHRGGQVAPLVRVKRARCAFQQLAGIEPASADSRGTENDRAEAGGRQLAQREDPRRETRRGFSCQPHALQQACGFLKVGPHRRQLRSLRIEAGGRRQVGMRPLDPDQCVGLSPRAGRRHGFLEQVGGAGQCRADDQDALALRALRGLAGDGLPALERCHRRPAELEHHPRRVHRRLLCKLSFRRRPVRRAVRSRAPRHRSAPGRLMIGALPSTVQHRPRRPFLRGGGDRSEVSRLMRNRHV